MVRPAPDALHAALHLDRKRTGGRARRGYRPALVRMRATVPQVGATLGLGMAALTMIGCAADEHHADAPRPPAPINVSAAITEAKVAVSPARFGAGPVVLIVSNQTDRSRMVRFETDELGGPGPGIRQETSPINPAATATLQLDLRRGTYRLSAGGGGPRAASIRVGAPRRSAQDDLMAP
jgi:hypothetical protein